MKKIHETVWLPVSADPVAKCIALGTGCAGESVRLVFPPVVRVYERERGEPSDVHVQVSPAVTEIHSGAHCKLDASGSLLIEIEMVEIADAFLEVRSGRRLVYRMHLRGLGELLVSLHAGSTVLPRNRIGGIVWLKIACELGRSGLNFPVKVVALTRSVVLSPTRAPNVGHKEIDLVSQDGVVGPFHLRLADRTDTAELAHIMLHPVARDLCPVHVAIAIAPSRSRRIVPLPMYESTPVEVELVPDGDEEIDYELPDSAVAMIEVTHETESLPWSYAEVPEVEEHEPEPTPTVTRTLISKLGERAETVMRKQHHLSAIAIVLCVVATLLAVQLLTPAPEPEMPALRAPTHFGIEPHFDEGQTTKDPCSRIDPDVVCEEHRTLMRARQHEVLLFEACQWLGGVSRCECEMTRDARGMVHYQVFSCRSH